MKQKRSLFVSLGIVSLATFLLLLTQVGCRCRLRRPGSAVFTPSVSVTEHKTKEGPTTELVLHVDDRVEKIALSSDSKRMVLETRVGSLSSDGLNRDVEKQCLPLRVELWNVEFADARPEIFTNENKYLVESYSGTVAFDEEGDRIFWLDQETHGQLVQSAPATIQNSIVRGAIAETESQRSSSDKVNNFAPEAASLRPLPLYLPWDDSSALKEPELDTEASLANNQQSLDRSASNTRASLENQNVEFVIPDETGLITSTQSASLSLGPQNALLGEDTDPLILTDVEPEALEEPLETPRDDGGISDETASVEKNENETGEEQDSGLQNGVVFINTPIYSEVEESKLVEKSEINVVMTKPLESEGFILTNSESVDVPDSSVKHMKTAIETKNAENVWISSDSKWLVCNTSNERPRQTAELRASAAEKSAEENDKIVEGVPAEKSETKTESKPQTKPRDIEPWSRDWALVPVRDCKRVVRFPETIKMTFDTATSNEEIRGRVVDVLAVSDAEDLVATLVMEQVDDESSEPPRYKIVIWDLNVARTVNLEKAFMPLRAIEVSQIAIPYPVDRKFCKFSPSGKSFAARIDPRYISVWQSTNGRPVVDLGEHPGIVQDFEFSPGETRMAVGVGGSDARVVVWEIRKGVPCLCLDNLPVDIKSIDAVAFSKNERFVYFANDIGEIRRWDIRPRVKSFD